MQLFLGLEHIFKSLLLCADYIIKDKNVMRKNNNDMDMDEYAFSNLFDLESFHSIYAIFRIGKEEFTRSHRIYPLACSAMGDFSKRKTGDKGTIVKGQKEFGRLWIHHFLEEIDISDINDNLILNLDTSRGCIKILDRKRDIDMIWRYLNQTL